MKKKENRILIKGHRHSYKRLLFISLLTLLCVTNSLAGVQTKLYELQAQGCVTRVLHDAVPGDSGTLILRSYREDGENCIFQDEWIDKILDVSLKMLAERRDLARITSVFLGRIVLSFPRISDYLIAQSKNNPAWNLKRGRPTSGHANYYANDILSTPEVLNVFARSMNRYGYQVKGMSCEKILINDDKLPYDGMCWVTIK